MYVIMAPGDEMTLQFDASSEKTLPRGWTRDFLLYTDGWIKDSDLNTAFGTTVEPLPSTRSSIPLRPGESYPTDSATSATAASTTRPRADSSPRTEIAHLGSDPSA
jgi:hypothetical protein